MTAFRTRTVIVWLVAGLVLQVSLLALRGTGDVRTFKVWALQSHEGGLLTAYKRTPGDPDWVRPDYPPLALVFLDTAANVARWIDPGTEEASRLLIVIIKAPLLVLRLLLASLSFVVVRRRLGLGAAQRVLLWTWLNPAIVLNGPALGYLDTLCWSVGMVALMVATLDATVWTGVALAACALIKPQGLFFATAVGVMALTDLRRAIRVAAGAAATAVVVLTPFIAGSGWSRIVTGVSANFTEAMLSGHALNAWWLVTAAVRTAQRGVSASEAPLIVWTDAVQRIVGINPQPWMAAVVIVASIGLAWRGRHEWSLTRLSAASAIIVHTYFTLALSVHENHLVYALAPLAVVAVTARPYRRLFWSVSSLAAVNMALFYGLGRDFARPPRDGIFLAVTGVLALVSVGLYVWHVRAYLRLTAGGATSSIPDRWTAADPRPRQA